MDQQVKRVKRELIKHGAILDMYEDTMELPDGKQETWDFISHRKGAAAVVPVRGDGKILMVKQYRNAIDRMTLEIPAGSRDSVTEGKIQHAFDELARGRTTLVSAHRLSTIRSADRILVVENGRIAEQGSHEALLAQNGEYASLWRTQNGKA